MEHWTNKPLTSMVLFLKGKNSNGKVEIVVSTLSKHAIESFVLSYTLLEDMRYASYSNGLKSQN